MSTIIYTGYVYIWYDTKAKLFYVGGHKGRVNDRYICSNIKERSEGIILYSSPRTAKP